MTLTSQPHLLDNQAGDRMHSAALAWLVDDQADKHPLAIATGYVNLGGLHHLATIADGRPTRLLIGAEPAAGLAAEALPLNVFDLHREALRAERDLSRFPPSRAAERLLDVQAWLDRPEVQVRRYTERFLHGKAYLFGTAEDARVALVTSANLTGAGLNANLELGVANYDPGVTKPAVGWFDALWTSAVDYEDDLRALLFPDPGLVDPQTVYLRALLELQPPELSEPDRLTRPGLELASFQRDGYERARAIARRHGGVVYADGVGTGKTTIGLAFIEERTKEDGVYALVVAPAQLAKRWREEIVRAKLPAQVISFNDLAADEQLMPAAPNRKRALANVKDAYRLVLVDEAHALRNEDTTWYRAMERLLGGTSKQVVLLTATPINNGLWDLYNLVMLFARHDRAFQSIGIESVRNLFLRAGANERDPEELAPDVLFPLADAVSVRRDRAFIVREYPGEVFPDGTPVRFPAPRLSTVRYDLDAAHPGLVDTIAAEIDALTMARYRPSAWELDADELAVEAQLGGLLKSQILKRFESCWHACLVTVRRMLAAHEAFLAAWEQGYVPSGDSLRKAARDQLDDVGIAGWMEEELSADPATRPAADYREDYGEAVAGDRERLATICDVLGDLRPDDDPKLARLRELLESSPAQKIAVFATFGDTVRYLAEHLDERPGGRVRIVVIGNETTPDARTEALARFAPDTIVTPGYEPPDGEVDLLISTDVLSEGQNLQQAQAVISYDMPWNPQRVVQRNGRVIRLLSPHDEVLLTTMLAEPGELETLLGLEARIQAKVVAAGVYGMESEVIEGTLGEDLQNYADRLAAGDNTLLDEAEEESGAFIGEELRRVIDRAVREGELERVRRLPWGVGACFRQTSHGRSSGPAGIFFAVRTPPMAGFPEGLRYWRFVESASDELVVDDLDILRRIDPTAGEPADAQGLDLERAWEIAARDIVEAHNRRTDLRAEEDPIGPKQRWALSVLRDPGVAYVPGMDLADEALSVGRSSAVRRALAAIEERLVRVEIGADEAAMAIVGVVTEFGLQPVEPAPLLKRLDEEDLGVVCWMGVLAPS